MEFLLSFFLFTDLIDLQVETGIHVPGQIGLEQDSKAEETRVQLDTRHLVSVLE